MDHAHDPAKSYDEVPYESRPLRPTHPDYLAVQARLAGLAVPAPDHCRVLEIGCAAGGNLLPMAISLPRGHFVGVDISPAQIAAGRRVQQELGVPNLELIAGSITDVPFAAGSFDYVVCHGVWSWVPEPVQRAILATIAHVLTPTGLAYVSYNTYPGWHLRSMVRDMLLYRTRDIEAPAQRIAAARAFVQTLHTHARDRDSAFVRFLGEEARLLQNAADTYVFHEHLETDNRPVYFHQFVAAARGHGLDFVGEAVPEDGWETTPGITAQLDQLAADPIERAQYLDFLRNRTFRRSLLCRAGRSIDPHLRPERLDDLWLASAMKPERTGADLGSDAVETFTGPGGQRLSIGHPWLKNAFALLGRQWPTGLPFHELAAAVSARCGAPPNDDDLQELRRVLLQCHAGGVLELRPHAGLAAGVTGRKPCASPLARWMARDSNRVTSLRHELVELREVDRLLLRLVDGTRDREALALGLRRAAAAAGVELPGGPETAVGEGLGILTVAALLLRQPGADA